MEGEMKGGGTERMCRALNYLYKKITSEQFQGESVRWYTHTQTQAHTSTRTDTLHDIVVLSTILPKSISVV